MNIDKNFIIENMMGPNSWMIIDELTKNLPLKKGMRVLDLGCGRGLTSIFLAQKFDVEVYALDLWISASDNYERFKQVNLDHKIIPLQIDALNLPFANEFFDAVISVDAYHYFGNNDTYFPQILKPLIKKDGIIALSFPGMKYEVHANIPEEMEPLWDKEALAMWHSIEWWTPKFKNYLNNFYIDQMECYQDAWHDWLESDNPYAIEDRTMFETDNNRYMNLIKITGNLK